MSVYFIARKSLGHVKIGHAVDPMARMSSLDCGFSTEELSMLATIPGDAREEKVLHRRFRALRLRGEWFRVDSELESVIATATAHGSLDSLTWFTDGLAALRSDQERTELGLSRALAANVRNVRTGLRLTQKELAKVAGLPRATVACSESGRSNPTLFVLSRLASALGVAIDDLLREPTN